MGCSDEFGSDRTDEFERGVGAGIDLARRQERSFVDGWREGAAAAFDALGEARDERLMVLVRNGPKYAWERPLPEPPEVV